MSTFFFHDANFLFSAAVGIVILLFIIELLGMALGISLLGIFDDMPEPDLGGGESVSGLAALTNWLSLDKLPVMIWFILLLTLFGLTGYILNLSYASFLGGRFLPPAAGVPIAIFVSLPLTGRLGSALAGLLPKNESSAIDNEEFVGAGGEITIGVARNGSPAEAKFTDRYRQVHYVLVEPFESDETFTRGEKIILVKKSLHSWLATRYK